MKTSLVKHIPTGNLVTMFVVDNVQDIKNLLISKIITPLHVDGMTKTLAVHGQVVVNESGGYCNPKGTFEL